MRGNERDRAWVFKPALAVALAAAVSGCGPSQERATSPANQDGEFAYARTDAQSIITTHRLKYRFTHSTLLARGPLHRTDAFNGVPYNISLSGFLGDRAAVLVHAERVADGSGASNYDAMEAVEWPTTDFRSEGAACTTVPPEEVSAEHDLSWMAANGFDPAGQVVLQQYFTTTEDHNDEIVLTLVVRVETCAGDFDAQLDAVRSELSVARY